MRNARRISSFVFVAMLALLVSLLSETTFATVFTSAHPVARVTRKVDNGKRSMLRGHVPAALRTAKDLRHLDPNTRSDHMIMVLRSDEQQKREIRRVIDEQQDKRTVNYHQWATPQEFGAHFGVHDDDIAQIKAWLASQGLTVDDVSQSKRVIHFSGTTGQIEQAFQTEMHTYVMGNGETHVSNNSEITVPEALSPLIAGVSLHNFFRKGHMGEVSRIKRGPNALPATACITFGHGICHHLQHGASAGGRHQRNRFDDCGRGPLRYSAERCAELSPVVQPPSKRSDLYSCGPGQWHAARGTTANPILM